LLVQMSVTFSVSASVWAWVVGRTIAFGPTRQLVTWWPSTATDTWYRLTPLYCRLPVVVLTYLPLVLALSQLPLLLVRHVPTQLWSVLSLVSWHAFVPIFVVHAHSERMITTWCLLNTVLALGGVHGSVLLVLPVVVFVWLTCLQLQLQCTTIVRHAPDEARQPRLV
jgi:hypothetical protein